MSRAERATDDPVMAGGSVSQGWPSWWFDCDPPLWNNRGVRAPLHRLLCLAALVLWMAPSVAASSSALHVALDHHGAHGGEHAEAIADLVRAATHGHHHDLMAPEHEHEASLRAPGPLPKPVACAAIAVSAPLTVSVPGERSRLETGSRRGPPRALFTTHCSLLL